LIGFFGFLIDEYLFIFLRVASWQSSDTPATLYRSALFQKSKKKKERKSRAHLLPFSS